MKGSEVRKAEHTINPLILDRWSPRAMGAQPIDKEQLMQLFEAAKWAPSSYNDQPWRFLYATRDNEHFETYLSFLVEFNKMWCKDAAALIVVLSRKGFMRNDKPNRNHSFDVGAATQNLALQATSMDLVCHAIAGFDVEKTRSTLNIPDMFEIDCMLAIGKPGNKESLPEDMQARESPNERRALAETVFEGNFPNKE